MLTTPFIVFLESFQLVLMLFFRNLFAVETTHPWSFLPSTCSTASLANRTQLISFPVTSTLSTDEMRLIWASEVGTIIRIVETKTTLFVWIFPYFKWFEKYFTVTEGSPCFFDIWCLRSAFGLSLKLTHILI